MFLPRELHIMVPTFSEHSFFHSFSIYHQSSPLLFVGLCLKVKIRPFLITLNCKVHSLSLPMSLLIPPLFPLFLLPYPQLYGPFIWT